MFMKALDGGVGDRIVENVDFLLVTPLVDLALSAINVTLSVVPLVPMDVAADMTSIDITLDAGDVLTIVDNSIDVEICE
jgi:hypothetical protein